MHIYIYIYNYIYLYLHMRVYIHTCKAMFGCVWKWGIPLLITRNECENDYKPLDFGLQYVKTTPCRKQKICSLQEESEKTCLNRFKIFQRTWTENCSQPSSRSGPESRWGCHGDGRHFWETLRLQLEITCWHPELAGSVTVCFKVIFVRLLYMIEMS